MNEITQIRKLSLWIFLVPIFGINLCLIISQNPQLLENTIFEVDQIGISGFSIPYIDGSLSISRAARTYPQFLVFKPAMWLTALLLYFYWTKNNQIVNLLNATNINYKLYMNDIEIVKLDFFRSDPYQDYFRYLDSMGGLKKNFPKKIFG